jgi:hypothetical protein
LIFKHRADAQHTCNKPSPDATIYRKGLRSSRPRALTRSLARVLRISPLTGLPMAQGSQLSGGGEIGRTRWRWRAVTKPGALATLITSPNPLQQPIPINRPRHQQQPSGDQLVTVLGGRRSEPRPCNGACALRPDVIPARGKVAQLGDEWFQLWAPGSQKRLTMELGGQNLILGRHGSSLSNLRSSGA